MLKSHTCLTNSSIDISDKQQNPTRYQYLVCTHLLTESLVLTISEDGQAGYELMHFAQCVHCLFAVTITHIQTKDCKNQAYCHYACSYFHYILRPKCITCSEYKTFLKVKCVIKHQTGNISPETSKEQQC